MLKIIKSTVRN